MKPSRRPFLISLTLLAAACGTPTDPSTEPVSFTHSVSFGFCVEGIYCASRLEVSPREAVLTYEGRLLSQFPLRHALDAASWKKLSDALDPAGLRALPDVVGCPDCADGGADVLTVAYGDGQVDSVTFEHGQAVRGIEALVKELYEVRESFPTPPPTAAAP